VIVFVLFASKRSVGVEAPSATRGLSMTCTRFSRLYTIRLNDLRAEIHFRIGLGFRFRFRVRVRV